MICSPRSEEADIRNLAATGAVAQAERVGREDSQAVQYLPRELTLPCDLSYQRWVEIGYTVRGMTEHVAWWWGDWCNHGERAYGEKYSQALNETGLDYNTLAHYASVARQFEVWRRRQTLSWSHHREVAPLEREEQDQLLDKAEEQRWTRAQLREELRCARKLAAAATPVPSGLYSTIVVDPPWPYEMRVEDDTHRGRLPYPSTSLDDIGAIRLPAADNCILWLWTTNSFMHEAFHIVDEWGFERKTILTWEKDKMGLGSWLRGKTEHCILATRGKPGIKLTNQTTILHGPRREHSRKPDEFFDVVEEMCPEPRLEMFARKQRPGWTVHGNETDKFS